jgi:glutamate 5-kinase
MTALSDRYKRIVVKAGSSLITEKHSLKLRQEWLRSLCLDVAEIKAAGTEVLIVSSGAVALGRCRMGGGYPGMRIEDKQAYAAIGQSDLIHAYRTHFLESDIHTAQLLLTYGDCENRRSYLNIRNAVETLLDYGVVPVFNENDSVNTQELRFGDNDRLAAVVAQMLGADALILLSDVDGLYTANPNVDENAEHIPVVETITDAVVAMAGGAVSSVGSGGMITKIQAAQMATRCGCDVILSCGSRLHPLRDLTAPNSRYTLFKNRDSLVNARKRWILGNMHVYGSVFVDHGAVAALKSGRSLLPAGVVDVSGDFERGDTVLISDCYKAEVGRGLVAYGAADARLIKGHNSCDIEHLVGFCGRTELIHRNDLVLTAG